MTRRASSFTPAELIHIHAMIALISQMQTWQQWNPAGFLERLVDSGLAMLSFADNETEIELLGVTTAMRTTRPADLLEAWRLAAAATLYEVSK